MFKSNRKKGRLANGCCTLLILYLQFVQVTYSASVSIRYIVSMDIRWQALNVLILATFFLFLLAVFNKLKTSLIVSCALLTAFSIANHYVLLYHGSPFFAGDFYSIKTAVAVIPEYRFAPDNVIFRLLVVSAAEAFVIIALSVYTKRSAHAEPAKMKRGPAAAALVLCLALLWGVFFSSWTLFPINLIKWSWADTLNKYGYGISFLNSTYAMLHRFDEPAGYSSDKLKELVEEFNPEEAHFTEAASYPDIILIVNETLFDLDKCSGIPEGKTALKPAMEIPDIISGYSTVSLVGGGTNNTEYELLYSNSMAVLQFSAPFTVLNLRNSNSIVSFLKQLGYYTTAFHCGVDSNYNRNTAYKDMGFDEIYLGNEYYEKNEFFTFHRYGERPWLDSDNYQDMIGVYNTLPEKPRFMYLLTFQNHGGYEQNSPEYDTIHVSGDYGEYTDDIDEYLTSEELSAKAFRELTEYYSNVSRPVIILMVGDHAPSIINKLPVSDAYKNSAITKRIVPYFVWANFELDSAYFTKDTSMTDLLPVLLKSCRMPMTTYYNMIFALSRELPVRTSDGLAVTADGGLVDLTDETLDCAALVKTYYYLEYNNIRQSSDYVSGYFTID